MCSSSGGQICITQPLVSSHYPVGGRPMHQTATYRPDDTTGRVMQFWPPDDEHMCSKHVEAWNKLTVKQKFCASSWLITEINIPRCTVRKTSKFVMQNKYTNNYVVWYVGCMYTVTPCSEVWLGWKKYSKYSGKLTFFFHRFHLPQGSARYNNTELIHKQ
jgi:hypothetical protein